jgi:hypothetical protein
MTTETPIPQHELINVEDIYRRLGEHDDILTSIRDTLQRTYKRRQIIELHGTGSTNVWQQVGRFYVDHLIVSVDAAAYVTLSVGTRTYGFQVPAATVRIDLPILIDRALNVQANATGNPKIDVYLVGVVE